MSYISDERLDYQGSSMEDVVPSSDTTYSVEDRDFLGFPSLCQFQLRLRRASSATSTSDEAGRSAR